MSEEKIVTIRSATRLRIERVDCTHLDPSCKFHAASQALRERLGISA